MNTLYLLYIFNIKIKNCSDFGKIYILYIKMLWPNMTFYARRQKFLYKTEAQLKFCK